MTLGERIKKARTARGLTQEKLGELCGTTKQAIFKYEAGIVTNIPTDRLERIAEVLNTTPAELMGWADTLPLPDNVVPYVPAGRVPLVGDIACGEPILAEQNIVDYVDVPGHIKADYALTCHGESMINLGIMDGDIVYVRQQEIVNNGQIAAVIIDDEEATLKRFHYDGSTLVLIPANDRLAPRVFEREAMNRVRVLGLAVGFTHVFDNK